MHPMSKRRHGDWRDAVWTGEEYLDGRATRVTEPTNAPISATTTRQAAEMDRAEPEVSEPHSVPPTLHIDWDAVASFVELTFLAVGVPIALVQAVALLVAFDDAFVLRPNFWLVTAVYVSVSLVITQSRRFERYVWPLTAVVILTPILLTGVQRAVFQGLGLGASTEAYAWALLVPVLVFHLACIWRRRTSRLARPRRRT